MKKFILALTALFCMTVTAKAMSYEQAREQALFLTDKMAYELNLTDDQYEAAYEINLDYLMSINNYDDLYGVYWERRNMDLSYILLDWQYRAYCAANYFYRPLYWDRGYWHFGIYARYPHRNYFYFGRPHFYISYRGGHSWHMNGGRSWYHGRNWGMAHRNGNGGRGIGMRNRFDRGDFRNGSHNLNNHRGGNFDNRNRDNRNQGFGNRDMNRGTDRHDGNINRGNGSFDNNRGSSVGESRNSSVGNSRSSSFGGSRSSSFGSSRSSSNGSFGNSRSSSFGSSNNSSGRNGLRESSTRQTTYPSQSSSFSGGSSRSSSFGGRSSSAPSRSSSSSMGTRSSGGGSFGGSRSSSSNSHGNFGGRR